MRHRKYLKAVVTVWPSELLNFFRRLTHFLLTCRCAAIVASPAESMPLNITSSSSNSHTFCLLYSFWFNPALKQDLLLLHQSIEVFCLSYPEAQANEPIACITGVTSSLPVSPTTITTCEPFLLLFAWRSAFTLFSAN
jgi:hypothetical protein